MSLLLLLVIPVSGGAEVAAAIALPLLETGAAGDELPPPRDAVRWHGNQNHSIVCCARMRKRGVSAEI